MGDSNLVVVQRRPQHLFIPSVVAVPLLRGLFSGVTARSSSLHFLLIPVSLRSTPPPQVDSIENFTPSNTPSREDDLKSHLKSRSRSPSTASDMEPIEVGAPLFPFRDSSISLEMYLCCHGNRPCHLMSGSRAGRLTIPRLWNSPPSAAAITETCGKPD